MVYDVKGTVAGIIPNRFRYSLTFQLLFFPIHSEQPNSEIESRAGGFSRHTKPDTYPDDQSMSHRKAPLRWLDRCPKKQLLPEYGGPADRSTTLTCSVRFCFFHQPFPWFSSMPWSTRRNDRQIGLRVDPLAGSRSITFGSRSYHQTRD